MKRILIFGLSVGVIYLALFGTWRLADARSFQLFGKLIHRVETTDSVVALTFDDGPTRAGADSILSILQNEDTRATFFFTGQELSDSPDLGPRFVAAGHELGNHSFSHKRFVFKSQSIIRREIEETDSLIRAAGFEGAIHFRPPYGKKLIGLPRYLSRTGRTTIMWDVEPDSYPEVASTSRGIEKHVLEQVKPGSIVILHVMYPSRATSLQAVRGIVRGLKASGYELVTVSELIEHRSAD